MAIEAGQQLLHYRLIEKIGEGGMGVVWRAHDTTLDRDVAIKVLPQEFAADVGRLARLEREAKAVAALNHPNIITVHSVEKAGGGLHFFTMELVNGTPLSRQIPKDGLPLKRFLEVAIPLADAISAAHEKGVTHRDLKPANIMVTAENRVKVLDFGLAKLLEEAKSDGQAAPTRSVSLTHDGQLMGTVPYMSPEQVQGRSVDHRSDLFSLGVILYELATGERPFQADTIAGMVSAILRDVPAPVQDKRPDLPADLARVIRRCLEKKVERRIQTARDVYNELEDLRAGVRTDQPLSSPVLPEKPGSLSEHAITITTDHVRQLSTQIPRMVGDFMTYLDNERSSDLLIICVHGIGADQRDFEDVLRQTSYRAVAISLYGFGPVARLRPSLPYTDHNRLTGYLIEQVRQRLLPKTLVLVGHSSGADQLLEIVASPLGERLQPDGLVLLGPAVVPGEGRMSGPYSRMTVDQADILDTVRTISAYADNLTDWLITHDYLLRAFSKFKTDTAALQGFAKSYIESLSDNRFFELFRAAAKRTRSLYCVFGSDDTADLDCALKRHIADNALGDEYSEEMIVDLPVGHIDLKNASVVLHWVEEVARRKERGN